MKKLLNLHVVKETSHYNILLLAPNVVSHSVAKAGFRKKNDLSIKSYGFTVSGSLHFLA